jgi:hypothetical protein
MKEIPQRKCHVNHSTDSPGKLTAEAHILACLNPTRQPRQGYVLGTLGNPTTGAQRHVEFWTALGYDKQHQIIVDYQRRTHDAQREWAAANDFPIHNVWLARVEELVPALLLRGINITTIDFDVSNSYGEMETDIVRMVLQLGIPRLALTFTTRGQTQYFGRLGYRLGLDKKFPQESNGRKLELVYQSKGKSCWRNYRYRTCEVVTKHIDSLVASTGYTATPFFPYRGAGNTGMATVCIFK